MYSYHIKNASFNLKRAYSNIILHRPTTCMLQYKKSVMLKSKYTLILLLSEMCQESTNLICMYICFLLSYRLCRVLIHPDIILL